MQRRNKTLYMTISFTLCISLLYSVCFFALRRWKSDAYISTANEAQRQIVVLDAGHGGEDSGAIGESGVYEKDLNLEIAFKLGEYLTSAGFEVVYTRTEDKLLYTEEQNIKGMRKISDLKNRIGISNSYFDAIFVSIHMNSYVAKSCSGLQVYYGTNSEESHRLADDIQSEVVSRLQRTNRRKTKSGAGLYLLENSQNPAVLIECGFLSNPEECEKLSQKEYQKELSFAILCGIIKQNKKAGSHLLW